MDQGKIGMFIASCRMQRGMTQQDLADKLGVTNKAVSKWETGKCLPDVGLFEDLCGELSITVNELLAGERIEPANLEQQTVQTLIGLSRIIQQWRSRRQFMGRLLLAAAVVDLVVGGSIFLAPGIVTIDSATQTAMYFLNFTLVALWLAYARLSRDHRPAQKILLGVESFLFLDGLASLVLRVLSIDRGDTLRHIANRVALPLAALFSGEVVRFGYDLTELLVILLSLGGIIDAVQNLRKQKKAPGP